ncbi:transglycosylase SLT domain-containing protein [Thalassospira profundimaris]|uniref:Transglycosylase SLT domain-containing protein n=1 Tax=Thalassospira profundimaris TaxID=502049 RepID=A0A367WP67_9PROT|nr:transglycosylase SLT domain-containing protein [Thalassospira profundimaris]RCK43244.1 hypothetical protein TH30_19725 [Thalassospira profundimaris]
MRAVQLGLIASLVFLVWQTNARASQCQDAIRAAERIYGIPQHLLLAMNEVETLWSNQAWAWSLNVSGKPRRYRNQKDMLNALDEITARTENVDIGCMQINWRWVGKICATDPADLVAPYPNAECSAMYLRSLHDQLGSWHKAVEAYHVGPNRKETAVIARASGYACKVGRKYAHLLGKENPC